MKESRLLHYTAKDLGVTDPTKFNSRIAEANAQQQDIQHAAQVSLNQSTGQTPSTGGYVQQAQPVATNQMLAEAKTVYSAQPGQQTVYQNPNNGTIGQTVNIPDGQIALNAFNRLNDSGMSYTDSANRLNAPSYKQGIAQASNTYGSMPQGYVDVSTLTPQGAAGPQGAETQAQFEQRKAAVQAQNTELLRQQQLQQQQAQSQATRDAAGSAASQQASQNSAIPGQTTATPSSPDEARVNAMIQSLPPEYAFLGDAYRAQVAAEGEQKGAAAANYQDATASADASHDGYAKIIDQMASDQKTLYEDSKEFIATAQENRQKAIAEQQALTKEMLAAQEQSQNREMRRNLDKQLNSLVTAQALGGGFGSSNWNAEVSQAAYDGEQAILDMHKEFGFKKVDADIQFTEQMNSVYEFYGQKKLDAMKDYRSTLDQIAQYRFSNEDTTTQRKDKARADYRTTLAGIAKDHAAELKDLTKTVYTVMNQARDDQRAQEQLGWQRMEWVAKTYGTNAPQALLDSIAKQLPGVDVASVAKQMTLAEMKKAGGGGGGVGMTLRFAPGLMKSDGSPPTFNDFLISKEKAALAAGAAKFDTSAKAMADYKKEYEATLQAHTQNDPTEIVTRFEKRMVVKGASGPEYKRAHGVLQNYLANGQYELASDYVDGIGDDVSQNESTSFQQALNARYDVLRLHDAMNDLGRIGPVTGYFKNLNPYDPAVVRVQNMITQTVPNLARGVFREVGVLTDADVARYTQTLENPKLTVQEAQNAYNDLVNKINTSMQNQISVWDANGKRTAGFKQLYQSALPNTTAPNDPPTTTDADQDYALSILGK